MAATKKQAAKKPVEASAAAPAETPVADLPAAVDGLKDPGSTLGVTDPNLAGITDPGTTLNS